ncbi:hypothetical protein ACTHGU_10685 [Chitinophagaceae bacterium MMS25-I14]
MNMEEFNKKYHDLGDAVSEQVTFLYPKENRRDYAVQIVVCCINHEKNIREILELSFSGIVSFALKEGKSTNVSIIEAAYYYKDDLIIFDFSAEMGWQKGEKVNSSYLYVISKEFKYKVIE